jgi:pimeloyl-ACP methyl ester carboxylesterase
MSEQVPTRLGPLSVTRHGDGGAWLVLWHSLFLDGRSWDPVLPVLTPGRSVLVLDGPCHGTSAGPERPFTLDDCAAAAVEVMDHFHAETVDWVGNAWGGHVGVVLAAAQPRRVRKLAVLSSPMQALRPFERVRLHALTAVFRLVGWRDFLAAAVVDALVLPSASAATRQYVKDAAQAPGAARTRLAMRSVMFGRPSLVERLPSLQTPTLFVTSTADQLWPPELARAHAARLPQGRLEILDGVRHIPPMEAPAATGKLLTDWLA